MFKKNKLKVQDPAAPHHCQKELEARYEDGTLCPGEVFCTGLNPMLMGISRHGIENQPDKQRKVICSFAVKQCPFCDRVDPFWEGSKLVHGYSEGEWMVAQMKRHIGRNTHE